MTTEDFFKQYPKSKKVYVVGKDLFIDTHYGQALIHAKKTGNKLKEIDNPNPLSNGLVTNEKIVLADTEADDTEADIKTTQNRKRTKKK